MSTTPLHAETEDRASLHFPVERALAALAADRRDPIPQTERPLVLDRLIDEELLLQRAKDLGLEQHDRGVRGILVSAMIETILAEAAQREPSDDEVAAFYRENAPLFTTANRIRVRAIQIDVREGRPEKETREVVDRAAARLRAGDDFTLVARELGDLVIAPVPDSLMPVAKVREYLGPSLTEGALGLLPGQFNDPLHAGSAFHVLQMVERETGAAPPLAAVEKEARAAMRKRADDRALRAALDDLRRRATIRVRKP